MKKEWVSVFLVSAIVVSFFFYKTVTRGLVPFPGDSLMSDFQPWRSASYEGYAPGGVPSKAQYPDVSRQIYPWKTLVVNSLKQGKLPLWNPYSFSGSPLLANFQSAALYPLNIFYLTFPQIDAWTLLVMLQPFLALIFTYGYMRKIGSGPLGAAMASLSYGFSGFMAVWLEYNSVGHVILWLPLILLAIEHQREKPNGIWLGILAVSNSLSVLAGHPQVYAYMLAFSLTYAFFRTAARSRISAFLFSFLGVGIAGIQLIPGIELIASSARSPHDPTNLFTKILIQPWQLLSLPFPNIFGNPATRTYWPADTFVGKVVTIGLVPLFFSLSAFRRKDAVTKWFIVAYCAILLLITANPLTYFLYRIPIPLITSSSPTLMSFLFSFSLSVICGLGLDFWMTDKHSIKKLVRRSIEVVIILLILILAGKVPVTELAKHASVLNRAIIYGGGIAVTTLVFFWVAITFPKIRVQTISVLLIVHTLDLFVFFARFNPFVPKAFVFPDHPVLTFLKEKSPDRYWGYGTANIPANFSAQYGIYSPEGYDPLYLSWYGQYLYSYRDGKFLERFDNQTRSDAAVASSFGDGGLSNNFKSRVLSSLSVRYILDRKENGSTSQTLPPEHLEKMFETGEWRVYENKHAAPRAYFANQIEYADNSSQFEKIFFAPAFDPKVTTILPTLPIELSAKTASGTASILSYEPETVVIETQSSASGLLVLTDTYEAGWQAYVDGEFTEIFPANYVFRGINVPGGTHTVVFEYRPTSVVNGIILSLVSLSATIIGVIIVRKKFA